MYTQETNGILNEIEFDIEYTTNGPDYSVGINHEYAEIHKVYFWTKSGKKIDVTDMLIDMELFGILEEQVNEDL